MINRIYYWLHRLFSRPDERGEYSSGLWPDLIRSAALKLCAVRRARILEIGCGEGLFLAQASLAPEEFELWGVDNSALRIEQARRRLEGKNVRLSVEDATGLSFNDSFFDRVICVNVFFNMPTGEIVGKTLLEMKRVAKKDGRLIFDFRNAANPLLALKYWLAPFYDSTVKELPLKTYTLARIRRLLEGSGLEIVSLNYPGAFCGIWPPVILVEAKKK